MGIPPLTTDQKTAIRLESIRVGSKIFSYVESGDDEDTEDLSILFDDTYRMVRAFAPWMGEPDPTTPEPEVIRLFNEGLQFCANTILESGSRLDMRTMIRLERSSRVVNEALFIATKERRLGEFYERVSASSRMMAIWVHGYPIKPLLGEVVASRRLVYQEANQLLHDDGVPRSVLNGLMAIAAEVQVQKTCHMAEYDHPDHETVIIPRHRLLFGMIGDWGW